MVEVWARRGPAAGRRIEIPDEDLKAATAENGWATELVPGAVLETDPSAPFDPSWKIPGYEAPPESKPLKDKDKEANGAKASETTERTSAKASGTSKSAK